MDRFLVISKDKGEQIYNGYTQEELINTLHEQGITDADIFILGEDNKT